MHVTAAATSGVLRLVPLTALSPVAAVESTVTVLTPHARSSGFTRPSAVGPLEEKLAIAPLSVAAPQVMTLYASAGARSEAVAGSLSWPSLPAAVQQTTPFAVAMLTALVVTAMSPFRSACVYQSMYPSELVATSAPCASMNSRPAT